MISPLLTDFYQFTMAYGYWKLGMHERESVFHLIFRKHPFKNNYVITCGLATAIDFLKEWHFSSDDLAYLESLRHDGQPIFSSEFLTYLADLRFSCDVDAIPEGNVVFPHEPLLRIKGPLLQGQLLESTLLNIINFQSLIATKASRVYQAAQGDSVFEFGLRRAQGPDGALSASRAAYIGGCNATSNVLAGKYYDIPVRGTHAHSWVTAFPDEITAFKAYADVMPKNCALLVDTFDSLEGIKNAIQIGHELRKNNTDLMAIRLDSGDITELSIKARQLLDEAGFHQTNIIASNSLDEYVIAAMKDKKSKVSLWGVGTNLVTAYDHPALDGVYKLSAIRDQHNRWTYKLKLSEQAVKVSTPGICQVRRFFSEKGFLMDAMYDEELGISNEPELMSLNTPHTSIQPVSATSYEDLLKPIFRKGEYVYQSDSIHGIRERAIQQANLFIHSPVNTSYFVGLEKNLHQIKQELIQKAKSTIHPNATQ